MRYQRGNDGDNDSCFIKSKNADESWNSLLILFYRGQDKKCIMERNIFPESGVLPRPPIISNCIFKSFKSGFT